MSTPYEPNENDARIAEQGRYSWDRPDGDRTHGDHGLDRAGHGADRGAYGVDPQGGYAAAPYQQSYGMAVAQEGRRAGQLALAFGVIGLFFNLGLIFGPLALWQANKADRAGGVGLGGRVLGWVAIGLAIVVTLFFIAYGVFVFSMLEYMSTELGNEFSTRS
ncbi:hypothetical protein [Micrococcus sp. FDAARGOS_333]|uniref:hypothetical protein n=1 Tax=Micrococcus sp. FDAARGOS_333 TaxID=1930558 RepID=UPI000B4E0C8D|nr:hypothetical protein [Micrococcus sp. FDAARGOS_333]PNL17403.1 hypothetical protein CEQ11_004020 [Micrococcus sp. FDAARGOS_333]